MPFTLPNLSHVSWMAAAIAGATAPIALSHPIPATPVPSALERRQEASIPEREQRISIVSEKDEEEVRETEAQRSSHPSAPVLPT